MSSKADSVPVPGMEVEGFVFSPTVAFPTSSKELILAGAGISNHDHTGICYFSCLAVQYRDLLFQLFSGVMRCLFYIWLKGKSL